MILKATNICKSYKLPSSTLQVLKGIDLEVKDGEVLSIVGPSGAGKSTLLHILGGLDRPTEGQVIFGDKDLYTLSDTQRSKIRNLEVGFVFQFYHLLPELSAVENVLLPALVKQNLRRSYGLEVEAQSFLDQVGLLARLQHRPHELSGGEQQRVAIARALMNRPKIIFCDEPTGNLDSQSGDAIINLLMTLNEKFRQTLVIVTHDQEIAKRSHRVVHIRDGKLEPVKGAPVKKQ